MVITNVATAHANYSALQGENVQIDFTGEDGEDVSLVRVFASTAANPTPAQEIYILDGFSVGPGVGSGTAIWNTTGVTPAAYNIFAEIDDRTYDPSSGLGNRPVRTTFANPVSITVPGTTPLTNPPKIEFVYPLVNLGLSRQDEVTTRYRYHDLDSPVHLTLLLDTDLNPTNDDINNPGNPLDPNTKIIILPSAQALPTDPPYQGIRTNPRDLPASTAADEPLGVLIEYRFTIDFQMIPARSQPYYLRATVNDGTNIVHAYAAGSLTVSAMAQGPTVDVSELGFRLAGARFHGFSEGENLGTDFVALGDLDSDRQDDFLVAGQFASPRNRYQSGGAYLIFGRRKMPFPPDTNNNGRPDETAEDGTVVDYPEAPTWVPNPYDSRNVGRFGGVNSINSVGQFFRGTIYAMPKAHSSRVPPVTLVDPSDPENSVHLNAYTAGVTSIARFDFNQDETPDLVFGVPFVSDALESADDDPADGCGGVYSDSGPNWRRCSKAPNDNIRRAGGEFFGRDTVNEGMVIMVDGKTDIAGTFRLFVDAASAGQFDPRGHVDDENVGRGSGEIPLGVRIRGAWFDNDWDQLLEGSSCCVQHPEPGCDNTACQDAVCDLFSYCCAADGDGWDWFCAYLAYDLCEDAASPDGFLCSNIGGFTYTSTSEFGSTVSALPRADNDSFDELLISSPGFDPLGGFDQFGDPAPMDLLDRDRGRITVWWSNDLSSPEYYGGATTMSLPVYTQCSDGTCTSGEPAYCLRCWVSEPTHNDILGDQVGDRFGYAAAAGDFNQDGTSDIVAGAPGADRNGLIDCGVVYIFAMPVGGFGDTDLSRVPFPHVEVVGDNNYDRFGQMQTGIADISMDTIQDVAFASEWYDGPNGADSGYIGVIFGDRPITGESGFSPSQVGTSALPGIRFYGASAGARAGHDVASAGDFNGDGVGDLLITSPGETRTVNGQLRKGVTYLIFGGRHLVDYSSTANKYYSLSQVGTASLPGIVFISRFPAGTIDEAPLDTAGGIGDIDNDGFDDIILGATRADFIDPYSPGMRRLDAGEVYIVYGSNHGSNRLP